MGFALDPEHSPGPAAGSKKYRGNAEPGSLIQRASYPRSLAGRYVQGHYRQERYALQRRRVLGLPFDLGKDRLVEARAGDLDQRIVRWERPEDE